MLQSEADETVTRFAGTADENPNGHETCFCDTSSFIAAPFSMHPPNAPPNSSPTSRPPTSSPCYKAPAMFPPSRTHTTHIEKSGSQANSPPPKPQSSTTNFPRSSEPATEDLRPTPGKSRRPKIKPKTS